MAAPAPLPLDEDVDLEAEEAALGEEAPDQEPSGDVDPMFAADIAEAFPELGDAQIAALQRAVLGLLSGGGGGMGGPPTLPF